MKAAAERAFAARASRPSLQPAMQPLPQPGPQPGSKSSSQPAKLAMAPAARPAEACTPVVEDSRAQQCAAMDASNKALTSKLVDLEGKVKRLQTQLAAPGAVATATAPVAPAAASAAATGLAVPAAAAAPAAAAPAAHSASGSITDARAAQVTAAEPPKPAAKPVEPPKAPAVPKTAVAKPPEEKPKKMSRPKLITTIAAGALGLLAVIGLAVHFLRKRRAKGGPLKIWQSFRKKDKDDKPTEPTMDEVTETPVAVTAQE
jgi:pilus assembly protein FimV